MKNHKYVLLYLGLMTLLSPLFLQTGRAQNASQGALAGMRLQFKGVPANGLVAQEIDLAPLGAGVAPGVLLPDGEKAISQFVPESEDSTRGLLLLQLPRGGDWDLQIRPGGKIQDGKLQSVSKVNSFVAENSQVEISFDTAQQGGLPSRLLYKKSGRVIENFSWRDRIYNGIGYELRNDRDAVLETARGPVATVVRNRARYISDKGEWPTSQPQAVYTWIFWNAQPLIAVRAHATQRENVVWKELHFLEFQFNDDSFDHFIGGEPLQSGALKADKGENSFPLWGAFQKVNDVLAQLGNPSLIYDGDKSYGTYLVLNRPRPFGSWEDTQRMAAAWLWIGNSAQPATELSPLAAQLATTPHALVTSFDFEQGLKNLRSLAEKQTPAKKRETLWRIARAEMAMQDGEEQRAMSWLRAPEIGDTSLQRAGDFGLALRRVSGGLRVDSVYDFKFDRELLAPNPPALWSVALHAPPEAGSTPDTSDAVLDSDSGWDKTEIENATKNKPLTMRWSNPQNAAFNGISVTATAQPDAKNSAWRWNFKVTNPRRDWGISSATFPRLSLADDGENTRVLYPFAAGMEMRAPAQNDLYYSAVYPGASAVMQLLAVYHADGEGLYVAMHDPQAAIKTIAVEGELETQSVNLSYEIPAPNMNVPATDFELSGQAVWQLLRGDWFDAGQIYKTWVQREARWWPKLGKEGREDTPPWMRRLSGWALINGSGNEVAPKALELQRAWSTPKENIPLGVHWYNWHQNPFDNDYPHYFPAKDGMAQSTREMQAHGIHLMPYINARLWDTRDKGVEDYEFSSLAKPFATKIEKNGELVPKAESYTSKESDGSPVILAAMCPSTKFWQDTVRDLVLKITTEVGTDAVYLDQVAAAPPVLCMDTTHPHPVGGGSWWVKSYNEMLAKIRAELPPGKMLTTECNAEPYIKSFDGYLTWNWEYDGQVPLFASVYGGAIQMFGRDYGSGPGAGKALRMRAAQQLMWGEQLGWVDPDFVLQKSGEADFMGRAVRARSQLARYFYAGEMARPPHLEGVQKISADWQWQGARIVTTDAVMSGLWKIARERKAVLLLSNVSETPIEIKLDTNQLDLGVDARNLKLTPIALDGAATPVLKTGANALIVPSKAIFAWQVQW